MFCFQVQNPGIYLLCRINYVYIYTWTHANAREQERSGVRVQTESRTGERHTPHGRVKPTCLASASHLTKLILRKVRLFCSLAKRSIDKIQWFEWNFILSSFHWNATMECEKVYELFAVAFLPSIAWGWVSNTLREWGTVKPNAYPLGTF